MVYDNIRIALDKYVGTHEKEPKVTLLQFRGHYVFFHCFCNASQGNEKGHVERSVEYVRRKAFGLKDHFTDIQEALAWLSKSLDKLNACKQTGRDKSSMELFEEEKESLGKLPSFPAACAEQIQLRVDEYTTVSYRTNRYSVPDHLVGEFVDVAVHSNELWVYYQHKVVAHHQRSFEKYHWIVDIEHYLSTFKRKPGALPGSPALAGDAYLKNLYQEYSHGEPRNFIDLLTYCRERKISKEKLEASVKHLVSTGNGQLTTEKFRALLGNENQMN